MAAAGLTFSLRQLNQQTEYAFAGYTEPEMNHHLKAAALHNMLFNMLRQKILLLPGRTQYTFIKDPISLPEYYDIFLNKMQYEGGQKTSYFDGRQRKNKNSLF